MKTKARGKEKKVCRSSITRRFVARSTAKKHPKITVVETIKIKK